MMRSAPEPQDEQMYCPNVVEDESVGACCHSSVGSEGQLEVQCRTVWWWKTTEYQCWLNKRWLLWKEELLGLVQAALQLVCRHRESESCTKPWWQKQLGIVCKELSDLVWREKKERRTRTSETTSQHRDDNLVQDFNLLLLPLCLRLITPGWWWLPVWCPSSSSSLLCPPSCPAPNLPAAKSASLIEDWRCVSIWICLHKPEVNYYH